MHGTATPYARRPALVGVRTAKAAAAGAMGHHPMTSPPTLSEPRYPNGPPHPLVAAATLDDERHGLVDGPLTLTDGPPTFANEPLHHQPWTFTPPPINATDSSMNRRPSPMNHCTIDDEAHRITDERHRLADGPADPRR